MRDVKNWPAAADYVAVDNGDALIPSHRITYGPGDGARLERLKMLPNGDWVSSPGIAASGLVAAGRP